MYSGFHVYIDKYKEMLLCFNCFLQNYLIVAHIKIRAYDHDKNA